MPEFFVDTVTVVVIDGLFDVLVELETVVDTERLLVPLAQPLFDGDVEADLEPLVLPVDERDGLVLPVDVVVTVVVVDSVLVTDTVVVPFIVAEL